MIWTPKFRPSFAAATRGTTSFLRIRAPPCWCRMAGEAMRADMAQPGELHRLIRRFLDYELPAIGEFRQARQQFKADLPSVLDNLRDAVGDAENGNPGYRPRPPAKQRCRLRRAIAYGFCSGRLADIPDSRSRNAAAFVAELRIQSWLSAKIKPISSESLHMR